MINPKPRIYGEDTFYWVSTHNKKPIAEKKASSLRKKNYGYGFESLPRTRARVIPIKKNGKVKYAVYKEK